MKPCTHGCVLVQSVFSLPNETLHTWMCVGVIGISLPNETLYTWMCVGAISIS